MDISPNHTTATRMQPSRKEHHMENLQNFRSEPKPDILKKCIANAAQDPRHNCCAAYAYGVGRYLGAEHSPHLESNFQSIQGIQMVACSTPYNAKGLMKAAIRSENPVIFVEHVLLYNIKERTPDEEYVLNLEEAEMIRLGEQVTILTYSRMRYRVMQAAQTLVNKGYDPEVIDIRSIKPFDLYTIGNSVKKTHRVLIVEECTWRGGIGASLTAAINENFHDYLDGPIVCLSSQDVQTPYTEKLEEWTLLQPAEIVIAVEKLCDFAGSCK